MISQSNFELFNTHKQITVRKNVVFGRKYTEKANKNTVSRERQSSHVRLSESGGAVLKFKQQQAVWEIENKERDVKPNQFKLLTHCDCFFRTYIQFKSKYGKVKFC